ncbi:unnamed protein product, partial [Effrenium voratum]
PLGERRGAECRLARPQRRGPLAPGPGAPSAGRGRARRCRRLPGGGECGDQRLRESGPVAG